MKTFFLLLSLHMLFNLLGESWAEKSEKDEKGEKEKKKVVMDPKEMFGSKSLRCLVCKSIIEEFDDAINSVDPNKKVETGSFRLKPNGDMTKKVITYVRSETHLTELIDTVCKEFEEYAQAKHRETGDPAIFRFITKSGKMSDKFAELEVVPDDDLNTRLKFYCEGIVEMHDEDLMDLFKKPHDSDYTTKELCIRRSKICKDDQENREEEKKEEL